MPPSWMVPSRLKLPDTVAPSPSISAPASMVTDWDELTQMMWSPSL